MNRMFPNQWPSTADQQASAGQEFIGLSDIAEFLRRYIKTINDAENILKELEE